MNNMNKKRLTVLIGAGAIVEATGISTASITKKVIKECRGYKISPDKNQSVVDYICKEYWETFGREDPLYNPYSKSKLDVVVKYVNFEDIFHVIELLMGYTLSPTIKKYTSAYKVFTRISPKFANIDRMSVLSSAHKIINVINDIVAEYNCQYEQKSCYFCDFLREFEKKYILNVFTLNYDTWCEQSLREYDDGFRQIEGYNNIQRFSISDYRNSCEKDVNTIAHLHGSILFGDSDFRNTNTNKYAYMDGSDCLYKYDSYKKASDYRLRSFKTNFTNQAGESILASNIITGLMKTDKLLWNPLMEYEHHFYRNLTSNNRLLIVGYGFPDKYINSMLWRFQSENCNDRRVMLITKANEKIDWQPQIGPPLNSTEMLRFTHLMFKNQLWYTGVKFNQVEKGYYSKDKMAGLYTCGIKNVVENYLDDVIAFFA